MRRKSEKHLRFIRSLSCCVCGDNTSVEAAHVRMPDPRIGKPLTGIGIKPDDEFVVPLCSQHHREQHSMSERRFWELAGIDAILTAVTLAAFSGDIDRCDRLLQKTVNAWR